MNKKNFSIVIPIFNEEKNIINLINEIEKNIKQKYDYEIIFVNDNSADNSINIFKKLNSDLKIQLINNEFNYGQSRSVLIGIQNSQYNNIVTLDGDGQNNPKDIESLVNLYFSKNYKLIGGIRFKRKDSIIKIFASRIANIIRSFILDDDCIDTGCSLKIFDKIIFLEFPFFDGIHRFLPALFKGFGHKTFFVEVDHRPRIYGTSKYGLFKRLFKGIIDIIRVKYILLDVKKK